MSMNRLHNASNHYQGPYKRVLCVCSAGLLRSPTAAWVLGQEPYNYNTRAAGLDTDHALIAVDEVLLSWADEVVCMQAEQAVRVEKWLHESVLGGKEKRVINLDIPDSFAYRDPELVKRVKKEYNSILKALGEDVKSLPHQ